MKALLVPNAPPYGTERCYNGLLLARSLAAKEAEVTVFLMADSVACAKAGQRVPPGYYNLGTMLKSVARKSKMLLCGTCLDARDLTRCRALRGRPAQHHGSARQPHPRRRPGAGVLSGNRGGSGRRGGARRLI